MAKTIIIGMSGGVDSAAAAGILLREGWDARGVFLIMQEKSRQAENENDARKIAKKLGVPFQTMNISSLFEQKVLLPFVQEYLNGRTPNPCILCNPGVKLHSLMEEAKRIGAEKVATGHYVKVEFDESRNRWILKRAEDKKKDQSYFLAGLSQEALSMLVAPLGNLTKEDAIRIAKDLDLDLAVERPSSQEICFIAGNYREFLQSRLEVKSRNKPGDIVDAQGRILGRSKGLAHYTIGQREGLGISSPYPLYVIELDPTLNRIIVGKKEETYSQSLRAGDLNWVALEDLKEEIRADVQIRYRKKA
ncbi:tRNA 2-thiouridine(34) synthase MnmA, partial [Candidatus Sumerlaeota bacterium]|nr:tRNA 2-thiouridine(34) synthase MnmA [Candidatus Sumerlaeota bacterium]